jgi:hypothetical protein
MLSAAEIARIKEKIAALERSREECADSRIREVIEFWVKEQKEQLESERHAS